MLKLYLKCKILFFLFFRCKCSRVLHGRMLLWQARVHIEMLFIAPRLKCVYEISIKLKFSFLFYRSWLPVSQTVIAPDIHYNTFAYGSDLIICALSSIFFALNIEHRTNFASHDTFVVFLSVTLISSLFPIRCDANIRCF